MRSVYLQGWTPGEEGISGLAGSWSLEEAQIGREEGSGEDVCKALEGGSLKKTQRGLIEVRAGGEPLDFAIRKAIAVNDVGQHQLFEEQVEIEKCK